MHAEPPAAVKCMKFDMGPGGPHQSRSQKQTILGMTRVRFKVMATANATSICGCKTERSAPCSEPL